MHSLLRLGRLRRAPRHRIGALSPLPVIAGLHRVGAGGTLVAEETGAHLETLMRQRMAAALVRGGAGPVLAAHSEYVVSPL